MTMRLFKCCIVIIISTSQVVFGSGLESDWSQLKKELKKIEGNFAARKIVENWSKRPADFFTGIDRKSWKKIIRLLSLENIMEVQKEEFDSNLLACQAFAEKLPTMSNKESLSKPFRLAVYKFLTKVNNLNLDGNTSLQDWMNEKGPQAIASLDLDGSLEDDDLTLTGVSSTSYYHSRVSLIAKSIPVSWIEQDGKLILDMIVTLSGFSWLGFLAYDSLVVLLKNPNNACQLINLQVLKGFNMQQLKLVTPSCMAAILKLNSMDLSSLLNGLSLNIFEEYNGPLSKETVQTLSTQQLESYASKVKAPLICTLLELHNVPLESFDGITSRCLYGYLGKKWKVGLGKRWSRVSISILESFTPQMQTSWINIHPGDFMSMPQKTRQLILSYSQVCATIDISTFGWNMLWDISSPCLYTFLSNSGPPQIQLGWHWNFIKPETISLFTEEMMMAFKNVHVSDFGKMPPFLLSKILSSKVAVENLPHPIDQIIVPPEVKHVKLDREQFARIARVAPNLAGQLLIWIREPCEDILADCDGDTLRSIKCNLPIDNNFDWNFGAIEWNLLFKKLEATRGSFYKIIKLMSTNSKEHICATIENLEEYLSLDWIRRNMNDPCRLAIKFDLSDVFVYLKAPELALGGIPWERMLEKYSFKDWKEIFAHKGFLTELGKTPGFWTRVNNEYPNIMMALDLAGLKVIQSCSVRELGDFLGDNVRFVPLLAADAFSIHKLGELPCSISSLSPEQLSHLSIDTVSGVENSKHVLSGTSLEELKSLNLAQFKSLFSTQWNFVPETFKPLALNWHLLVAKSTLKFFVEREERSCANGTGASYGKSDIDQILAAFDFCLCLWQTTDGKAKVASDLGQLVATIQNSYLRDNFISLTNQYYLPKVPSISFARTGKELSECLHGGIKNLRGKQSQVYLPYNQKTGFDRAAIIAIANSSPDSLANSTVRIVFDDIIDQGGFSRVLITQILGDIQRDLIINGDKFVWGVSSNVGFIVGLSFGKAFQLGMKLLFKLHRAFFALLVDTTDEAIEAYYKENYKAEMTEFTQAVKNLWGPGSFPDWRLLDNLTSPEFIRFTTLSLEADLTKAKYDLGTKTNILACGQDEGFKSLEDLAKEGFLEEYLKTVEMMLLDEFKEFVRQVVRGMGYAIPAMRSFGKIPAPLLVSFETFFPDLISPVAISGKDIVDSTEFTGDADIPSFIKGESIKASKVVTAFILNLKEEQLKGLLAIWTGAFTISLYDVKLNVRFVSSLDPAVQLDFCEGDKYEEVGNKGNFVIAPGVQYLRIFNGVTQHLFGIESGIIKPDCTVGGVAIKLIGIRACTMTLIIPLQSAQKLFNSLVDMINTPIAKITK